MERPGIEPSPVEDAPQRGVRKGRNLPLPEGHPDAKRRQDAKSVRTSPSTDAKKRDDGGPKSAPSTKSDRKDARGKDDLRKSHPNYKGYDATKGKPRKLLDMFCKERPTDNKRKRKGGGGGKRKFVPWCK